jgi:hypothetical protein
LAGRSKVHGLVTAFVLFHVVAFALWTAPVDLPVVHAFKRIIRPYLLFTGLFQAWDMFAPDPTRMNGYLEATILLRNGEHRVWTEPRLFEMSYLERYQKERYRKFMEEHLWLDAQSDLWPDAARRLARMFNQDAHNAPVNVQLTRHWSMILPPGPHGEFRSEEPSEYTYYSYDVLPEDLQ